VIGGISHVVANTSFIFKTSAGWRDNRMCSKTSEGSSDIETGHIANLKRGGVGEGHRRRYPRPVLATGNRSVTEATGMIAIGSTPNIPSTKTHKLHDFLLKLLEKTLGNIDLAEPLTSSSLPISSQPLSETIEVSGGWFRDISSLGSRLPQSEFPCVEARIRCDLG